MNTIIYKNITKFNFYRGHVVQRSAVSNLVTIVEMTMVVVILVIVMAEDHTALHLLTNPTRPFAMKNLSASWECVSKIIVCV